MIRGAADKLTEKAIQNAKPGPKARKLFDGHGLFLYVPPKGAKSWRYAFRHHGKPQTLTIGTWPETSLAEARAAHAEARGMLSRGVSPAIAKREAKLAGSAAGAVTFGELAEDYLARIAVDHAPGTVKAVGATLSNHVLEALGRRPADGIRPRDVVAALVHLEAEGKFREWKRAAGIIGRTFRYAIAAGRELMDPTVGLRGAVASPKAVPRAAVTDPEGAGKLMLAMDGLKDGPVKEALRMLAYVFTRPGELCNAEWAEIDLERRIWTIPAGRMKSGKEHLVPLSDQVLAILKDRRARFGDGRFVFPSPRVPGRPVSRASLLMALRSLGYAESAMSLHGFRSTASTLLNEMGFSPDWIERQLAHEDGRRIRAIYNRADYMEDRKRMMQTWADRLDGLREEARAGAER
ncbi:MAG: tyrosine-type recombinase/integrase [Deltaproteobacteria bacterium]|jgi:integrase|nr:tyrosine-type recombinase/integrase [Deltaproteobacteria bacterium]